MENLTHLRQLPNKNPNDLYYAYRSTPLIDAKYSSFTPGQWLTYVVYPHAGCTEQD